MKTIRMLRDFNYWPWKTRHVTIAYQGDHIYQRVPEAAVRAILAAGAGEIVDREWPASTSAQG